MPRKFDTNRRFSPRRTGDASPLGNLEMAVMVIIWSHTEALSVSEVHTALEPSHPIAYTTVKTTMERLADKGILSRQRDGKAYHYQAAVPREELERRIVTATLDRLVTQFPEAVASFFVRPDTQISEERLALLSEIIRRKREEPDA